MKTILTKTELPACLIAIMVLHLFTGCADTKQGSSLQNQSETVTVFAASGARELLERLCQNFEASNSCTIIRNYASSGVLARQIERGAHADVFISANNQWVDYLIERRVAQEHQRSTFASTRLVLVTSASGVIDVPQISRDYPYDKLRALRLAIGDPGYVPVGRYAKMLLDTIGWWKIIRDNLLLAKDVTTLMHYVQIGEADFGIVYLSEAINSSKVRIIEEISPIYHEPVRFSALLLSQRDACSNKLLQWIREHRNVEVFKEFGFEPVAESHL